MTGKRKGQQCEFPKSDDNDYCGRHQRNFKFEFLVKEGKIPCTDFFRGCDTIVNKKGRCDICKEKKSVKKTDCAYETCNFKTKGYNYCGKHSRQIYYDEEKEKNIKYCDIERGCFSLCSEGYSTCESCRKATYEKEKARKGSRVKLHNAIELNPNASLQICIKCGCEYEQFNTRHRKPSMKCQKCSQIQINQDAKRADRVRNYKNENFIGLENYFAKYVKSASLRNYTMNINFEEFKTLVNMPCYYCLHKVENEVNGIDRLNNDIGYETENCVPCCEICNMMKHYFHPLFFIEICRIISGKAKPTKEFYKNWKEYYGRTNNKNYTNYKKESLINRNIQLNITQEEWDKITRQSCYLCGYQDSKGIGIDRVDNNEREYNLDNIKPCCGTCNDIKNNFHLPVIKDKANAISNLWSETIIFDSVPRIKNPMRESSRKNEIIEAEDEPERKHWKSSGVYYDILSDGSRFFDSQGVSLRKEEYEELEEVVRTRPREEALAYIKALLLKLNIRRKN